MISRQTANRWPLESPGSKSPEAIQPLMCRKDKHTYRTRDLHPPNPPLQMREEEIRKKPKAHIWFFLITTLPAACPSSYRMEFYEPDLGTIQKDIGIHKQIAPTTHPSPKRIQSSSKKEWCPVPIPPLEKHLWGKTPMPPVRNSSSVREHKPLFHCPGISCPPKNLYNSHW